MSRLVWLLPLALLQACAGSPVAEELQRSFDAPELTVTGAVESVPDQPVLDQNLTDRPQEVEEEETVAPASDVDVLVLLTLGPRAAALSRLRPRSLGMHSNSRFVRPRDRPHEFLEHLIAHVDERDAHHRVVGPLDDHAVLDRLHDADATLLPQLPHQPSALDRELASRRPHEIDVARVARLRVLEPQLHHLLGIARARTDGPRDAHVVSERAMAVATPSGLANAHAAHQLEDDLHLRAQEQRRSAAQRERLVHQQTKDASSGVRVGRALHATARLELLNHSLRSRRLRPVRQLQPL